MAEQLSQGKQRVLMFLLIAAMFIATMNMSSIVVVVPCFMDAFQTDMVMAQWMSNGFNLSTCIIILILGYFADRFSAKIVLTTGMIVFFVTSLLSCLAPNIYVLILLRVIMGLGAGVVMPMIPTIVYQTLDKKMQLSAIALMTMGSGLAVGFGPMITGFFEGIFDWRCLFLINVVFIGLIIGPIYKFTPKITQSTEEETVEWVALAIGTLGTVLLLIGCSFGGNWGWLSAKSIAFIGSGFGLVGLFIWLEWHSKKPMLKMRILKNKYFFMAAVMMGLASVALILSPTVMSFYFQKVWGYSALQAGEAIVIPGLMMAIASAVVSKLGKNLSAKWVIIVLYGALTIITYMLGQLTVETSMIYIMFWLSLRYITIGGSDPYMQNCAYSFVSAEEMGHASAVVNWFRQICTSLALAVFTAIVNSHTIQYQGQGSSYEEAMCVALNDVTLYSMVVFALCAAIACLLKDQRAGE